MQSCLLEVCADSLESVLAAQQGGANRIELCSNLIIGGTTPSSVLLEMVKQQTTICTYVLIRPRFGDFLYTDFEFQQMKQEIKLLKQAGADGFVLGMLQTDGTLDLQRMEQLIELAADLPVTLHRAFDVCIDPLKALEQAKQLGISTILTSGQEHTAIEGIPLLRQLKQQAEGEIDILAGGGIQADVIENLYQQTAITSYHMSAKKKLESQMKLRRKEVSMGLPGIDEYEIWRSDQESVWNAATILKQIVGE